MGTRVALGMTLRKRDTIINVHNIARAKDVLCMFCSGGCMNSDICCMVYGCFVGHDNAQEK